MKKIIDSRKLLGVDKAVDLKELKSIYRNFMKDWHPDRILDNPEMEGSALSLSIMFLFSSIVRTQGNEIFFGVGVD